MRLLFQPLSTEIMLRKEILTVERKYTQLFESGN
jgi:hypothetical protein